MNDIDGCDLCGYIEVLAWRERADNTEPAVMIDELPFFGV